MSEINLDIYSVLLAQQVKIKKLFETYHNSNAEKECDNNQLVLAHEICILLSKYIQLAKDIFYPTIRKNLDVSFNIHNLINEVLAIYSHIEYGIKKIISSKIPSKLLNARVVMLYYHVDELMEKEGIIIFIKTNRLGIES